MAYMCPCPILNWLFRNVQRKQTSFFKFQVCSFLFIYYVLLFFFFSWKQQYIYLCGIDIISESELHFLKNNQKLWNDYEGRREYKNKVCRRKESTNNFTPLNRLLANMAVKMPHYVIWHEQWPSKQSIASNEKIFATAIFNYRYDNNIN